jgi:hypothetical protein
VENFIRLFIGEGSAKRAQQVMLCLSSKDDHQLDSLKNDLSSIPNLNCHLVYQRKDVVLEQGILESELGNTDLLMVLVTDNIVSEWQENGEPLMIRNAVKAQINMLPVACNTTALETFSALFFKAHQKNIHIILKNDAAYSSKLNEGIGKYLAPSMRQMVLDNAFQFQFFLSYRKMDLLHARSFMQQFHDIEGFEAVSIWYDRYLTPGAEFDKEIERAIRDSKAFVLLVTPNIIQKTDSRQDNFVVAKEYPYACSVGCPILPVEEVLTDRAAFLSVFEDCGEVCVTAKKAKGLQKYEEQQKIKKHLKEAFLSKLGSDIYIEKLGSERLFFLAMAYLYGFGVEKDEYHAVRLLNRGTEIADSKQGVQFCFGLLGVIYEHGFSCIGADPLKAISCFKENLKWCEEIEGTYSKSSVDLYARIANIYWDIYAMQQSLDYIPNLLLYMKKSADIAIKVFGADHFFTVAQQNNLAVCYQIAGNHKEAKLFYEAHLAEDDRATTRHKANLAGIYLKEKKYAKAIELFEQVIAWREKSPKATKTDKMNAYQNAAYTYFKHRDYKNARRRYEDAVRLCPLAKEDAMHEAHLYGNFADLCFYTKEYAEAVRWRKAAVEIRKSYYSGEKAKLAQEYTKLANFANILGFYQTAFESYQAAYELLRWEKWNGFDSSTKEVRRLLKKALKANKKAKKYPENGKKRIHLNYYLYRFQASLLSHFLSSAKQLLFRIIIKRSEKQKQADEEIKD